MMQISKTIHTPWNQANQQKLISFWKARRFHFHDVSDASLAAMRGSYFWNLISFDMSQLRADLKIHPLQTGQISVEMTVHTIFQQITQWNRKYWNLEMHTCESFLLHNDLCEEQWVNFLKGNHKAAIMWTLTLGLGGQRLPPKTGEK